MATHSAGGARHSSETPHVAPGSQDVVAVSKGQGRALRQWNYSEPSLDKGQSFQNKEATATQESPEVRRCHVLSTNPAVLGQQEGEHQYCSCKLRSSVGHWSHGAGRVTRPP